MAYVFFQATKDALDNITLAFDFVHPLRVSMQYARRTAAEINNSTGALTDEHLQNEFDPNQEIHGVGYVNAFLNTPWEEQEEKLAWLLLNNLFAIHEGWIQRLYEERFKARGYRDRTFIKNLEYPGLSQKFISYYAKSSNQSIIMANTYFDNYKKVSKLDFSKLENYMLLYRYYKEARNCYMHRNFTASQEVITAYNDFVQVGTEAALATEEVPIIIPPVLGEPIKLSIRGVIGFSQFVRRIIIISDINLIKTIAAEDEFLNRIPNGWNLETLSGKDAIAKGQITKYSTKAGFLKPKWSTDFQSFLIRHGLFSK